VPNDPALIHELTIDHLIDSLALRGPEYYGGDGRRIPEIDETAKEFRALVVVVKGKDDVFTETQAALIRDMVADLPGAWEIATWGRSKMQARVQLPIPAAPSFILHPFSQTVEAGQQAAFDALAKGTPRPVYQWQHSVDGVSWNDLSEDAIHSGVTTGTLTISDPDVSMSGHRYRVLAGNSEGSATSVAATLTVTESSGGRPNAPSTPDIKNTYSGGFSVFWSPAFGADGYYLELATDPAFENRVPGYDPMDVGHVLSTKISGIPSATYFVRVSAYNGVGTGPASFLSTVTTVPSRFTNLSTRGQTEVRDGVLILGFVISGNQPKQILVRAAGPALIQFGITEAVEDPRLVLYDARQRVLPPGNDDWDYTDPDLRNAFAQVSAFDFSDASSDSAMLMTLDPGLYSVHSQTVTGTAGVTIIELYELDEAGEFSNVSARAYVGTGDFVLIPGAVMAGGTSRVLVRAVGRTLGQAPFNVPGVLDDPVLAVHPLSGPAIATNDDWEENGPEAASQIVAVSNSVSAFPLPSGSPDAVILIDLASGPFTFAVSGKSGATGIVLLELYKAP
jgi:hypothetical protein